MQVERDRVRRERSEFRAHAAARLYGSARRAPRDQELSGQSLGSECRPKVGGSREEKYGEFGEERLSGERRSSPQVGRGSAEGGTKRPPQMRLARNSPIETHCRSLLAHRCARFPSLL
ncbi:hypothetical protein MTO96_028954 [Rhipicephalus appendiculatus]